MAEITELKNTVVSFPEIQIWFICWNNARTNLKSYGSILPTQTLSTPWSQIDYYNDRETWLEILLENGVSDLPQEFN
jgi:hypothetical protein